MKEKICPRCGTKFICNHDDIIHCQCATVKLSVRALHYVKSTYSDCLCAKCLKEINEKQQI